LNNLQIFKNDEFGEVRTLEIEGKPYFMASDIAKALGYTNPQKAIRDHCKGVNESFYPTNGGMQTANFIPEGDIYRLIVKSQLPSAEKFETWVFDEVLPSIRKTGTYQKPLSEKEMLRIQLGMIDDVEQRVEAVNDDLQAFKMDMPILGLECDRITAAVKKKGVNCLGGKDSNAYHDASVRGKVYQDIYGQLKREFGLSASYKAIKRSQTDTAITIIESYELPMALEEEINCCNAQMVLQEPLRRLP